MAVPDVVRSRVLQAVVGFHWGYRLLRGRPVEIFEPGPLALGKWNDVRELLATRYPTWSFLPGS